MKLQNLQSSRDAQIKALDEASSTVTTVLTICIGSAFCILVIAAATCYLYKRRNEQDHHRTLLLKRNPPTDRPLTLRKPTAVRSPNANNPVIGPTLNKKSPSPTGQKTPPGADKANYDRRSSGGSCSSKDSQCTDAKDFTVNVQGAGLVDCKDGNHKDDVTKWKTEEVGEREHSQDRLTKLGKLHFRLKYNYEKQALCVTIIKCTDLPHKDPNVSSSDPYVKLQLLPDKQHKVKTRVLRKTQNPVYDEDFTFYGLNANQLAITTLHFVVLSFDRYSRDDVIGEVLCQLNHLEFDTLEKQIYLTKDIAPRSHKIRTQGRGEILVSLCYQPAANRLTVVVLKARNLPKMDITGLCDPYVKIYLMYNGQRVNKKKTHVKKRTVNPVFNESFVFDVPYNEGLENVSLFFQLLDYDRMTKNEVIGHLDLGGQGEGGSGKHWRDVINSPRRQIAEWHKLKE